MMQKITASQDNSAENPAEETVDIEDLLAERDAAHADDRTNEIPVIASASALNSASASASASDASSASASQDAAPADYFVADSETTAASAADVRTDTNASTDTTESAIPVIKSPAQVTLYPDDIPIARIAVEDHTNSVAPGSAPNSPLYDALITGAITIADVRAAEARAAKATDGEAASVAGASETAGASAAENATAPLAAPAPKPVQPIQPAQPKNADATSTFSDLTTMRVGGSPEKLVIAHTDAEIIACAQEAWDFEEPLLLLGGGSNTIVADEGFDGTTLLLRTSGIEIIDEDAEQVRVRIAAGENWDDFAAWTIAQGLAGVEMLSGIPGLAGAAPIQNIGAYGGELSDTLHSITFFNKHTYEVETVAAADLQLGYRTSALKTGDLEGIVLGLELVLQRTADGLGAPIRYEQLANALGAKIGATVPLQEVRDAVLQLRASKGMVLSDTDRDSWSAGSFFTNPIVSEALARRLPPEAPRWELSEPRQATVTALADLGWDGPQNNLDTTQRQVKLSAAWLIEQAGIGKGFRLPGSGAAISHKHSLAITNRGGASAADVAELARYIVTIVQMHYGITLHPEPNLYGLELG